MTSSLYKIVTSDAVQSKLSHMSGFLIYTWKFEEMDWRIRRNGLEEMGRTQMFCQMKGLMKIHNRGKFHLHSICGSQVTNIQKFSWWWGIYELGYFGRGVLGPNSPKNGSILVIFAPEVVFKERNRVLKFFWRIPIFTESTRYQSFFFFFSVFVQLWGPFTPWRKPKSNKLNILEDKI